ncbi:Aldo-keto reductase family 1 member A1-A [Dirofilaria immitis]
MAVPTIRLSTGRKMPIFGLGMWLSKPGEAADSVRCALSHGYRLIDTAACYFNEQELGKVLDEEFIKPGKLKREDVFITTKLWCTHNRAKEVEEQLRESLTKLRTSYVDLYLIHMPTSFDYEMKNPDTTDSLEELWTGMEGVYRKGLTKAIGVSNFSINQIERVQQSASIKIHNVQVECHLYLPQFELHEVCKKYDISLTSYASLGSPGRVNWEVPNRGKMQWPEAKPVLEDEIVKKLSKKYGKTPAQICLRYLIERDIAVIPKSVKEDRIKENFNIFDFKLTESDMEELNNIKHRQRLFLFDYMINHPEDPFKDERK